MASELNSLAVLARPFIDATTGLESSISAAVPGVAAGDVLVSNDSYMYGAEINCLDKVCGARPQKMNLCGCNCMCCYQIDWLCGFRYINFKETFDSLQNTTFSPALIFNPGEVLRVADSISVRDQFFGPQTGFDAVFYQGQFALELKGKIALGLTDEVVNMGGNTSMVTQTLASPLAQGGLYVLSTNAGRRTGVDFAVVPELGINLAYRPQDCVAIYVGYNFLYWSSVVRSTDQIDRQINPNLVPALGGGPGGVGPARPAPLFNTTDFWAQGLAVGLEFTW